MTKVLAVDENNDIFIGRDGRLALANDLAAVMQACEHAVKAQLGEMMFAVDVGVPNFQTIWRGDPNLGQYEAAIRAALLRVRGVIRVQSFDAERVSSVLSYQATIETIYGEAALNGAL